MHKYLLTYASYYYLCTTYVYTEVRYFNMCYTWFLRAIQSIHMYIQTYFYLGNFFLEMDVVLILQLDLCDKRIGSTCTTYLVVYLYIFIGLWQDTYIQLTSAGRPIPSWANWHKQYLPILYGRKIIIIQQTSASF